VKNRLHNRISYQPGTVTAPSAKQKMAHQLAACQQIIYRRYSMAIFKAGMECKQPRIYQPPVSGRVSHGATVLLPTTSGSGTGWVNPTPTVRNKITRKKKSMT